MEEMENWPRKTLAVFAKNRILIFVIVSLPLSQLQAPGGDPGTCGRYRYAEVDCRDA
jgi:hypothetical protein